MSFTKRATAEMSDMTTDLLIALLVLIFVGLVCIGTLYMIRRIRLHKAIARQSLPQYNDVVSSRNSRRLTITTSPYSDGSRSSIYVYDEKSSILSNGQSTPTSPVPEIRITFPDEQDEAGRRKSGRVVVVRVGENGVGLEPLRDSEDEQLPAYEKRGFTSIDIERIGGLKEKSNYS